MKKVDEIMVLDIDASVTNSKPNLKLIENLAVECQMPLCYGGGIKSIESAQEIFQLGVEKISLSSIIFEDISIISQLAKSVGSQSVVIFRYKEKYFCKQKIYINNGKVPVNIGLDECLKIIQEEGAGEVVVNNIDLDGTMTGYDLKLINYLKEKFQYL